MTSTAADLDATLSDMLHGYRRTQVLTLMVRLGIADALADGPLTAAELAAGCRADTGAMTALLHALAGEDLLTRQDDRFTLTALGDRLRGDVDSGPRVWAEIVGAEQYQAWGAGLAAIRDGSSGFQHAYGTSFWEHLSRHPRAAKAFNAAMTSSASAGTAAIAAADDFGGAATLVDVGGGTGAVLAAILTAHPLLTGTLFDAQAAGPEAAERMAREGVADRCVSVRGSFLDAVPAGADLYLLCRVLCDWSDRDALRILRNCRRAMRDDSRLLIAARLTDDERCAVNPMLDLHMRIVVGGWDRTHDGYRELLTGAGLTPHGVQPLTGCDLSLIPATVS